MTDKEKRNILKKLEEDKKKLIAIKEKFGKEYVLLSKPIRNNTKYK